MRAAKAGQVGGGLRRAEDLVDDVIFGKVYDQTVVFRLLKYLKNYKFLTSVAVLATILFTLTTLVAPFLVGRAIDGPIAQGKLWGWDVSDPSLFLIFLAFVASGLIGWGSTALRLICLVYVGQGVFFTMRTQMFNHLQKLSLSFYDRHQVGRIMSRVGGDIGSLQEVFSNSAVEVAVALLTMVGVATILFIMNAKLALIALSIMPVLVTVLLVWQRYARSAFMKVRQAASIVNAELQESISGARVIQSLAREDESFKGFDTVNEANMGANLKAVRYSAGIFPVTSELMGIARALVIVFGGTQVLTGELLLGEFITFILYMGLFFGPIINITMQYTQLQRAMAGGQRVFEVLDTEPEIVDAADAIEMPEVKGEITFDHVHHEYVLGLEVLHDINLKVAAGETVALVGATGAGKSTLVNLVGRFYEIAKGTISIDGYDISRVTQESLRLQIGMVLQDPFIFAGTVRENVLYGRADATEAEMIEAATAVGAHEFIVRLENGYNTELQQAGSNLSLGQRQLISFSRAILANPRILILDEATSNVDTQTEVTIQRALSLLLKGRTSLVIAHRLSTIRDADRVVVLDDGRIVEMGTHQELLDKGGVYHNLYAMSYAYGNSTQSSPETGAG